jgi:hypothetical protein
MRLFVIVITLFSSAEIRKMLGENWIRFIKKNSHKISPDNMVGSTPPSLFVGQYGYPNVRIGPMISSQCGDTTILGKTELWAGRKLEEIAGYRLSLVLGTKSINVRDTSGRFVRDLQVLAMSKSPAESEAIFEKNRLTDTDLIREFRVDFGITPFGPTAPLKAFKTGSFSTDQRIETAHCDSDLPAVDAIMKLYLNGVETSVVERVLSLGMLGLKKKRKLVPTRWSISATDDIISSTLAKKIEGNSVIDYFEVTRYSHLANDYSVILIPEEVWRFEMLENWFSTTGQISSSGDYEYARKFQHNPTIAGSFFASRLAVAEHLAHRQKRAAAIVLREIHPEYVIPLGVWQIREGVRESLKRPPQKFETLDRALSYACSNMSISKNEVERQSRLWRIFKTQTRISDFV